MNSPDFLWFLSDLVAAAVFWGPMAFAIMGGLLVATVLTLVFLPAVYLAVFARKDAQPDVAAVHS